MAAPGGPPTGYWACEELKMEARWLADPLRPFLLDPAKKLSSRVEFDAFVRRECPGGVSLPVVSTEFCELIQRYIKECARTEQFQELNSLGGLRLENKIPGFLQFMQDLIAILRRVIGFYGNINLRYASGFAIRYQPAPAKSVTVAAAAPKKAAAPKSPSNRSSRSPYITPAAAEAKSGRARGWAEITRKGKADANGTVTLGALKLWPPPTPISYGSAPSYGMMSPDPSDGNDGISHHFEHDDGCDLTLNINIGEKFEGGEFVLACRSFAPEVPIRVLPPFFPFARPSYRRFRPEPSNSDDQIQLSSTDREWPVPPSEVEALAVPGYASPRLALPNIWTINTHKRIYLNEIKHLLPLMDPTVVSAGLESSASWLESLFSMKKTQPITEPFYSALQRLAIMNFFQYSQVPGRGLIHAGRQTHATLPVTSGARLNLIMFINTTQPFNEWNRLPSAIQMQVVKFFEPVGFSQSQSSQSTACSSYQSMARAGGGGGLSVTVSPAGGPVGTSGSGGGSSSGASSHHFEFTGTIGVNRANDDGSVSIPNANGPAVAGSHHLRAIGTSKVVKRSSGKLTDMFMSSSPSMNSLRSVLGAGGASITGPSPANGAGGRRGSGQLTGPPLVAGISGPTGAGIGSGSNSAFGAPERSGTPHGSSNTMRPPSQQHMRRFSAAAANNMSLSASPSLPTLGVDGGGNTGGGGGGGVRGSAGHARSSSRSASPQPGGGLGLAHSSNSKQFGHAHSLSVSVQSSHALHNYDRHGHTASSTPTASQSPSMAAMSRLTRPPVREGRRRTAERGEVKAMVNGQIQAGGRNSPISFAASGGTGSPSSAQARTIPSTTAGAPISPSSGAVDTASRDESGENELRVAVKQGKIDRVRACVDRPSININMRELSSGDTILHTACLKGSLETVQTLLRHRKEIDPNIVNNQGWTSLMVAAGGGALDVVKCLVQEAPTLNINIHRSNGWTAVMEAAKYGQHLVVQYLVSVGADIQPTRQGEALMEIRPMLPCTRAMIADAVRKGQQILAGQPVTGPPSARRTEAKESANAGDSDDDDDEPLSARSERKMKEAKEALRKRAENKLTDSKVATSSLKMAEAAIVREDLLKEQVQAANRDVARAQIELERVKTEASEQKRELQSRIRDLETLLKQEREKNESLAREMGELRNRVPTAVAAAS